MGAFFWMRKIRLMVKLTAFLMLSMSLRKILGRVCMIVRL